LAQEALLDAAQRDRILAKARAETRQWALSFRDYHSKDPGPLGLAEDLRQEGAEQRDEGTAKAEIYRQELHRLADEIDGGKPYSYRPELTEEEKFELASQLQAERTLRERAQELVDSFKRLKDPQRDQKMGRERD
jgi:hypothetical protein